MALGTLARTAGLLVAIATSASAAPRLHCVQGHASGLEAPVGGDDRPLTGRWLRCSLVGLPATARQATISLETSARAVREPGSSPRADGENVGFWFTLYPGKDFTACAPETVVQADAYDETGALVGSVEQSWRQRCEPPRDHGAVWDDDALDAAPRSSRELVDRVTSALVDGDIAALVAQVPPEGLRLGKRRLTADEGRRLLQAAGATTLTGLEPECEDDDDRSRCAWGKWTVVHAGMGLVWATPLPARGEQPIRCLVFVRGDAGWRWGGVDHFAP